MRGRLWSLSLSQATDIVLLVEAATRGIKATCTFAQIWWLSSWWDSIKKIACNDLYGTIKVYWTTNYLCVLFYFWDCNLIMLLPLLSPLKSSIYIPKYNLLSPYNVNQNAELWFPVPRYTLQNIPTPKSQATLQKRGWKDFIGQRIGDFLWKCVSL